jgi:hypothetical protein
VLSRNFGFSWGIGGFLLTPFLQKVGMEKSMELRSRVAAEIKTTFAITAQSITVAVNSSLLTSRLNRIATVVTFSPGSHHTQERHLYQYSAWPAGVPDRGQWLRQINTYARRT